LNQSSHFEKQQLNILCFFTSSTTKGSADRFEVI